MNLIINRDYCSVFLKLELTKCNLDVAQNPVLAVDENKNLKICS